MPLQTPSPSSVKVTVRYGFVEKRVGPHQKCYLLFSVSSLGPRLYQKGFWVWTERGFWRLLCRRHCMRQIRRSLFCQCATCCHVTSFRNMKSTEGLCFDTMVRLSGPCAPRQNQCAAIKAPNAVDCEGAWWPSTASSFLLFGVIEHVHKLLGSDSHAATGAALLDPLC